jgi:hypothetical protein
LEDIAKCDLNGYYASEKVEQLHDVLVTAARNVQRRVTGGRGRVRVDAWLFQQQRHGLLNTL